MGRRIDEAKGRVKEAAGAVADDPKLEREGEVEQGSATVKEKAEEAERRGYVGKETREDLERAVDRGKEKIEDAIDRD